MILVDLEDYRKSFNEKCKRECAICSYSDGSDDLNCNFIYEYTNNLHYPWKRIYDRDLEDDLYICSYCGYSKYFLEKEVPNKCPHCGCNLYLGE